MLQNVPNTSYNDLFKKKYRGNKSEKLHVIISWF